MSEYGPEAGVPNPAIQQYENLFNKHSALERWKNKAVKLLEQANDHIGNQDREIAALKRAIRHEHTLGGSNTCLKARQGIPCEICALLKGADDKESER